jgi:ComEC/Rec2-related protein
VRAVIIISSLIFSVIISIRLFFWWEEMNRLRQQDEVKVSFVVSEPLRTTVSYCIIAHRGIDYRVRLEECRRDGWSQIRVGDMVEITGSWKTIVIKANGNEKSFIHTTDYLIWQPESKRGHFWWQGLQSLYDFRSQLLKTYQRDLPEPEGSLLAGIVLGEQASLPDSFARALRKSGLTHVVAASGYNVTVIAGLLLSWWTRWLSRRQSALMAMMGIGGYVVLAGASPPVIRAGIMGMMALAAVIQGRWYWSLWALGITSGLMLIAWPWLIGSISFQLSVAATLGMTMLVEPVTASMNMWSARVRERAGLMMHRCRLWLLFGRLWIPVKEAFITTLAATIATMPVQAIYFEEISWLGLLANPLLLWMIPLLMYLGLAYAFLGILWQQLAAVMSWLVYPPTHMFVIWVSLVNRVPVDNYPLTGNWWLAAGWWLLWWCGVNWLSRNNKTMIRRRKPPERPNL